MPVTITKRYQELDCYRKMGDEDKRHFDCLVDYYGGLLNAGPARRNVIYTLHDFDHHCYNLYHIIAMYILGPKGLEGLNHEERYLLNLAVLFHDISMCTGGYDNGEKIPFDRNIHSLQSAQWLKHEYENSTSVLHAQGDLTVKQIEIIGKICKAHSDIKGSEMPTGLYAPDLKPEQGRTGVIRVKTLAAILRVADEMDVTSDRLGTATEEDSLLTEIANNGTPERQRQIDLDRESRRHWKRLHYIIGITRVNNSTVALELNRDEVVSQKDKGDDYNIADDLAETRDKIQRELDTAWREAWDEEPNAERLITLRKVDWNDDDKDIIDSLCSEPLAVLSEPNQPSDDAQIGEGKGMSAEPQEEVNQKVTLLDNTIASRLRQFVLEHDLFNVGHYQLNTNYCARDWIMTSTVLENEKISQDAIHTFSYHILNHFYGEKYVIVGLDVMGTSLAAKIGFSLNKPMTYVIPAHQLAHADSHEYNVPTIPRDSKIILVTDSTITGLTISQIVEKNNWQEKLLAIYTVFYREPKLSTEGHNFSFPCEVYALSVDFPAEIAPVKSCPYGRGADGCKAVNKRL